MLWRSAVFVAEMVALDSLAWLKGPLAHRAESPDAWIAVDHLDGDDLVAGPHVPSALAGVVAQFAVGPEFPGLLV